MTESYVQEFFKNLILGGSIGAFAGYLLDGTQGAVVGAGLGGLVGIYRTHKDQNQ